ncbi:MAG TPA: zf-HC2 domain-containing protein [Sedimentisphaerales bacterium]|nr:zf-HC2 domain-containing protein [Sedimentisphaerales bacterium]
MEKFCEDIEKMLVDYADGQLSPGDSSKVAKHLAKCKHCRRLLAGLQKSLELAGVIWADGLAEIDNIRIPAARKTRRIHWTRYAAIAASISLVVTASVVWRTLIRPEEAEITFAEIEREITESASAARLLAATELLAEYPDAQPIADQQYRYIAETYPETTAANKAKSKIQ